MHTHTHSPTLSLTHTPIALFVQNETLKEFLAAILVRMAMTVVGKAFAFVVCFPIFSYSHIPIHSSAHRKLLSLRTVFPFYFRFEYMKK